MIYKNIIFIGDRYFALSKISGIKDWHVTIFAVPNSFLEKELIKRNITYIPLPSKKLLLEYLKKSNFDMLISNGCPFILPIASLKTEQNTFINLHPSYLPNLRGKNPVNAAILFNKDIGATCHIMDDSMDNGDIIARVKIPVTKDIDLGLLYQLCFMAEAEVFLEAYRIGFTPRIKNKKTSTVIEYTRSDKDLAINFQNDANTVIRQVRAFNSSSQGAYFLLHGETFKVFEAEKIINPYLLSKIETYQNYEVAFKYDSTIIIRHHENFLKLKNIQGNMDKICIGDLIANEQKK